MWSSATLVQQDLNVLSQAYSQCAVHRTSFRSKIAILAHQPQTAQQGILVLQKTQFQSSAIKDTTHIQERCSARNVLQDHTVLMEKPSQLSVIVSTMQKLDPLMKH
jgi:hypothetical protein